MLTLNVKNETSRLRAVVLGTAVSNGPTPKLEEAYDPKSSLHIKAGTYPVESDMVKEMEAVAAIFKKYDVKVYRPELIQDCNQIFARDIAFVIDDVFVKANILPERENELEAIQYIIDQIDPKKVIRPPEEVHIEGGDVMLCNDYIFIGTYRGDDYSDYIVARTNKAGVDFITKQFPDKKVKSFDLNKSQTNAHDNALHLDCCFQPIGTNKAILHKEGFRDDTEFEWLLEYFGKENCFIISKDEMFNMNSNIFSISENVIISEKNFTRLNTWLRDNGFTVEEVPYAEISKQEGLLRCSTMPLLRD
ncbi:dimethylarginine dimethylaminohydrolase family protein [Psychroserpens sp. NJDZ02]|uniref:dimethylarginine dimethylaminohydrolase family protein n=1 Tax=Psychroserpens sp. NJDZ02 TaxID=2570561 RepID=UPI0010A85197|nr:arginine deiminase family protein [Psychroserpens sp. NJDZ02]QCE41933.1 amidinotransferase [Psychroserpens sp. NJDZ02]